MLPKASVEPIQEKEVTCLVFLALQKETAAAVYLFPLKLGEISSFINKDILDHKPKHICTKQ